MSNEARQAQLQAANGNGRGRPAPLRIVLPLLIVGGALFYGWKWWQHQRLYVTLTAHEPGGNANDLVFFLKVQRIDVPEGIKGEELGASLAAVAESCDCLQCCLLRLDDDRMQPAFQRRVDGRFEASGNLQLRSEDAEDARYLRRFAKATGIDALDERMAKNECVPRPGGDPVVLGLDAHERLQAAFKEVEFAQVQR